MTVSTTQAKADTANTTEGSVVTINVTSNDNGKNLSLYSVAQGGTGVATTATTANGATVKIVNGKVTYDTTSSATINALAEGQVLTDTFTYSVRGSDGVVSTSTVTVKVTGDNDKPVLALDASGPHAMIESATGAAVTATGVLSFTDVDRNDVHTVTDSLVSAVWSGGPISSESRAAIAAALSTSIAQDSTNGATGSVAMNFSLADSVVRGLGAGETLTMTYSVSISDGKGGVSSQPVTFTVTGTNDAPTLEAASVANLCLISGATAFGTVVFADADINDRHTATTQLSVYHSTGALTAAQQTDLSKALLTTVLDDAHGYGFGDDGLVGWGFKLPASLARLATGQSVLAQYEMTVSDGKGGTVVQPISVLVVGGPNGSSVYAGVTGADLIETANTGSPVVDHAEGSLAIPDLLGWTIRSVTSNLAYSDWSGGALSASAKATLQAALTTHAETSPGFFFLDSDSKIVWDFDLPAATTDFLGAGETLTLAYQVTVTGLFGLKTTELVTITLTGTNDKPVLAADATPIHAITELAGVSGGTAANAASGVLTFTDADQNGAHAVSVGPANAVWSAGVAPAATSAALASALTTYLTENGAGAGQVAFTFSLANGLVDFLAAGETYKVTYLITVTDAQGASSTQPVVFTLTGTNDKPVLAADSVASHPLIETAGQSGQAAALTSTGSLTFTDPDLTNTHAVSVGAPGVVWSGGAAAPAATTAALASALTATLTETQGSGSVAFALSAADAKLDFLAAGETLTVTYLLTVTDSSGGASSQPVTFVFTGTNDAPTLVAAHAAGAVVEDGVLTAAGDIAFADLDLNDAHTVAATAQGANYLGTFTAGVTDNGAGDGAGAVAWSFAVDNAATQYLAAGQTLTQTYAVTVSDSHGGSVVQLVTVTITGANDAPTITSAVSGGAVVEDGVLAAQGAIAFADIDLRDAHTVSSAAQGQGYLGTFTAVVTDDGANDGAGAVAWSFAVDNAATQYLAAGQTLTQTYVVTVADGNGGSAAQAVTVTITGTNDAPTIASAVSTGDVIEGGVLAATGAIAFADLDLRDAHAVTSAAQGAGYVGTFTAVVTDDGAGDGAGSVTWDFAVDNAAIQYLSTGETLVQTYVVSVSDGNGGAVDQAVTVTITGTNDAPTIDYANGEGDIYEDISWNTVGFIGFSDLDVTDTHTVSATPQGAGYVGALTATILDDDQGEGRVYWSFDVDGAEIQHLALNQIVTQAYVVTIDDGHGGAVDQAVVITIVGTNDEPTITSAVSSGVVVEDVVLTATGEVAFADLDLADTHTVTSAAQGAGYVGSFSAVVTDDGANDGAGSVSWTFDLDNAAVQHLAAGQTLVQTYIVTVADALGATADQVVTVTLTGTNDAPTITATTGGAALHEDVVLDGSGQIAFADVDLTDAHAVTAAPQGPDYLGTFEASVTADSAGSGVVSWIFNVGAAALQHLAAGQVLTQTYVVTVSDGAGGSVEQTVSIDITGANDQPTITSAVLTGAVAEEGVLAATGEVAFADVDLADSHQVQVVRTGGFDVGTFSASIADASTGDGAGRVTWSFVANNAALQFLAAGETQVVTYDIVVGDGQGGAAVQTVVLTLTGANDAPTIVAVTPQVQVIEDGVVSAAGVVIFNDVDLEDRHVASAQPQGQGYLGTFSAQVSSDTQNGGAGQVTWFFSVDNAAVQYLAAGEVVTQTYVVTVFDTHGGAVDQVVSVTITGTNDAPTLAWAQQGPGLVEDQQLSTFGEIAFGDIDRADVHAVEVVAQAQGYLGSFSANVSQESAGVDQQGRVSWSFAVDSADVQFLSIGQTLTQHYLVTLSDGQGGAIDQMVAVTITGQNDAVVVTSAVANGAVAEDADLTATGHIAFADVDLADGHQVHVTPQGGGYLGVFTTHLDDASGGAGLVSWNFTVDNAQVQFLAAGQVLTQTYVVTIDDRFGGAVEQTVTVTITGSNDAPTITYAANGEAIEDVVSSMIGGVAFTDVDLTDAHEVTAVALGGGYLGSFAAAIGDDSTGDGEGTVHWTFEVDNAALQYLAAGETLTQQYVITVGDQNGAAVHETVTVTLVGTNDAPVISAAVAEGAVVEDAALAATGVIDFADVDLADSHQVAVAPHGSAYVGTFVAVVTDNGAGDGAGSVTWNFAVDNAAIQHLAAGEVLTQTYSVIVADGQGGEAAQVVSVTITGANDGPTLTGAVASGQVVEDGQLAANGVVNFADIDLADGHGVSWSAQGAGYLGTFSASVADDGRGDGAGAVNWSFSVANAATQFLAAGQVLTQTYVVTIADGAGGTVDQAVVVTLTGTNDAPTVTSALTSASIVEDGTVNVTGAVNFADVDKLDAHTISVAPQGSNYLGAFTTRLNDDGAGDGVGSLSWNFAVDNSAVQYLGAGQVLTQNYIITVDDGQGGTVARTIAVTITGTNDAPVAVADVNSALENGPAVTGNVLANDTDVDANATRTVSLVNGVATLGTPVTLASGALVTMAANGAYTYNPNGKFESLAEGQVTTDTFSYQVRDDRGAVSSSTVTVTLTGSNDAPIVQDVTLNGGYSAGMPLAIGGYGGANTARAVFSLRDANGDGHVETVNTVSALSSVSSVYAFASADIDGDGDVDIAVATGVGVYAFTNRGDTNGDGVVEFTGVQVSTTFAYDVAVGDLNGDGKLDLVSAQNGVMTEIRNLGDTNGNGLIDNFATRALSGGGVGNNYGLTLADLNGDGRLDMLAANWSSGPTEIRFNLGDTNGDGQTDYRIQLIEDAYDETSLGVDTGDIDGDGDIDFVLSRFDGQNEVIYLNNGDANNDGLLEFTTIELATAGATLESELIDLDRDGDLDIVSTEANGAARIVYNMGDTNADGRPDFVIQNVVGQTSSYGVAVGDADGDGDLDIVFSSYGQAQATLLENLGDTNGDGKLDFFRTQLAGVSPSWDAEFVQIGGGAGANTALEDGPVVTAAFKGDDVDSDDDVHSLTYTITSAPAEGSVVNNGDGTFGFNPGSAFQDLGVGESRTVSFTYNATDAHGAVSNTSTVTIKVMGTNDAPVVAIDNAATNEDTAVTINVLANDTDIDGDTLYVSHVNGAAIASNGVVNLAGGGTVRLNADKTLTYTPGSNANGDKAFTYTVADGHGGSATQTVNVAVAPVNDAPVAGADSRSTNEDTPVTINVLANDTDLDGDTLSVSHINGAAIAVNGVATLADGGSVLLNADNTLTYTPAPNANGLKTFTYTVSDGHGGASTQTVSVSVASVNDAPVAVADTGATNEDTAVTLNVLANDSDVDGGVLSVSHINGVAIATNGVVSLAGGGTVRLNADKTLTYTPGLNANGDKSFTYTVADGQGGSATQTVTVAVAPINDAPVAVADTGATHEDAAVTLAAGSLLANDTDVETMAGASIVSVSAVSAKGASVVVNASGDVVYDPTGSATLQALTRGQATTDTFTYVMKDAAGATSTATVTVTVDGRLEAPVAVADTGAALEDGATSGELVANDQVTGSTGASGNVLVNGSFEQGNPVSAGGLATPASLPGWTSAAGSFEVWGTGFNGNVASDGTAFLELDNGGARDAYSSTLATQAGREYTLKFDLAQRAGTNPVSNQVEFFVNGVSLGVFTPPSTSFTTFTVTFVGTGSDTITFQEPAAANDGLGGLIDNLRIAADADVFVTAVNGSAAAVGQATAGNHGGSFVIDANGHYVFNAGSDFAYLAAGQTATTSASYTVTDDAGSSTSTVTVTVTGVDDAPVLVQPLADATVNMQSAFSYTVAAGAFTDIDSSLAYTATLADGSALPGWLAFNAATRTFSGTPQGADVGGLDVKVFATGSGVAVSDTFHLTINAIPLTVSGGATGETLSGNAANDVVIGGAGSDTLFGGAGDDVISGDAQNAQGPVPIAPYVLTATAASYLTHDRNLVNGLGGTKGFGELSLPKNDDGFTNPAVNITSVFGAEGIDFFGTSYTSIFINNNGNITFGAGNPSFEPTSISAGVNNAIIAPFWADVDTRGTAAANVMTSPGGTSTGSNLMYYDLDTVNGVLTVTWDDVGAYSAGSVPNAFQLQLINQGNGNFDIIFRYEAINWSAGSATTTGAARMGYTAGDGVNYVELPGSGVTASVLNLETTVGNTGQAGVYVFKVRDGVVVTDNNDVIDGGAGHDRLTGGIGDDTFVFHAGQADGDVIVDFNGNNASTGDRLEFHGFGTAAQGATFVQVDATHWRINSADGTHHEVVAFENAAPIHATDWLFV